MKRGHKLPLAPQNSNNKISNDVISDSEMKESTVKLINLLFGSKSLVMKRANWKNNGGDENEILLLMILHKLEN